jgi:hypothetical protein
MGKHCKKQTLDQSLQPANYTNALLLDNETGKMRNMMADACFKTLDIGKTQRKQNML